MEKSTDLDCLVKEVKMWIHGKMYPSRAHQFATNPPNTKGHSDIPTIVDGILGIYFNCIISLLALMYKIHGLPFCPQGRRQADFSLNVVHLMEK